jgi:hypothetical protein
MGKCSFCKEKGHNRTTCPRLKKQHRERDKLGRFVSRKNFVKPKSVQGYREFYAYIFALDKGIKNALAHPDSIAIFLDIFTTIPEQDIEQSYIMAKGFIYAYVHEFGMQAQQGTLIEELNSNYQKRMDYDE